MNIFIWYHVDIFLLLGQYLYLKSGFGFAHIIGHSRHLPMKTSVDLLSNIICLLELPSQLIPWVLAMQGRYCNLSPREEYFLSREKHPWSILGPYTIWGSKSILFSLLSFLTISLYVGSFLQLVLDGVLHFLYLVGLLLHGVTCLPSNHANFYF